MRTDRTRLAEGSAGRGLFLLLSVLASVASACNGPERTPLSTLATEAAPAPEPAKEAVKNPLLSVSSADVPRLAARVRALLPLLLDPPEARQVNATLAGIKFPRQIRISVYALRLGVQEAPRTAPTAAALDAVVVATAPDGVAAAVAAAEWSALLAAVLPALGPGLTASCQPGTGTQVVCVSGRGGPPVAAESSAILTVALDIPALIGLAEETVGPLALWAAVPEEALHFGTLSFSLSETPDRIELSLTGNGSDVLASLQGAFAASEVTAQLPVSTSILAYTSVKDVPAAAGRLDAFWGSKLMAGRVKSLSKLVAESWKTQLLELVTGTLGVAVVGKLHVDKPELALVWVFQPTDAAMLNKRLEYVFSAKHFKLEVKPFRTGEQVKTIVRRQKGKMGDEWLAWFEKEGTFYLATKSNTLADLAEQMFVPQGRQKEFLPLALTGSERLKGRVALGRLLSDIILPEDAGLAGGMAMAMVKTAVEGLKQDIELSLLLTPPATDGVQALTVRLDNVLAVLDKLLEQLGPMLQMASN